MVSARADCNGRAQHQSFGRAPHNPGSKVVAVSASVVRVGQATQVWMSSSVRLKLAGLFDNFNPSCGSDMYDRHRR